MKFVLYTNKVKHFSFDRAALQTKKPNHRIRLFCLTKIMSIAQFSIYKKAEISRDISAFSHPLSNQIRNMAAALGFEPR